MTLRIVLSDDHTLFLEGLAAMLTMDQRQDFSIVAKASNGIQAIAAIKTHAPDVAVIDQAMPGVSGLEVFLEARRWSPDTRFVVLTGTVRADLLHELEKAGVQGLFLKSDPLEELCSGILRVANGDRVLSSDIQRLLNDRPDTPRLSPREIEVLQAIARGLSNPKIAETLHISPKTVDSHRTSLMAKMEVRSTATLLVAAMRAGLIDVDSAG